MKKSLINELRKERASLKESVKKFLRKKLFPDSKLLESAMNIIFHSRANDVKSLQLLEKMYRENLLKLTQETQDGKNRENYRVTDVEGDLAMIANAVRTIRYLDVGCSEGNITNAVVDHLRIPKENAFACDVSEKHAPSDKHTFVVNERNKLPFETGSFTLVTMFMSAHHFCEHLDEMLAEVYRVVQKGGYIVAREHDCYSNERAIYYDFIHAIYACVMGSEQTPEEFVTEYKKNKNYAVYYPKAKWCEIFESHGFSVVKTHLPLYSGKEIKDRFDSFYLIATKK